VSDGIIAAGYTPEAVEILSQKKKGGFIILQGDVNYQMPDMEYREVAGAVFAQKRNNVGTAAAPDM
jgi:phosphoribosylaminoimidazolecarboxamide formyltransferase/IMP cyclohydrolase